MVEGDFESRWKLVSEDPTDAAARKSTSLSEVHEKEGIAEENEQVSKENAITTMPAWSYAAHTRRVASFKDSFTQR